MRIYFRVDSSFLIGTGHVMRCLTLATELRKRKAICLFICREHPGNIINFIRQFGFDVISLSYQPNKEFKNKLLHSKWLACDIELDAIETISKISSRAADWLIVDHYAVDDSWEKLLSPYFNKLMVIDDLADRKHICNILLDQNMIENLESRYQDKVPKNCVNLLGSEYALVRSEFNQLRNYSLNRRGSGDLNNLLIFLGGIDFENETCKVLEGIKDSIYKWKNIDVVIGENFIHISQLEHCLDGLPEAKLHVQTPKMAILMAEADFAITGGGSITWEKYTLGLPSLVSIQAENQGPIVKMAEQQGAVYTVGLASSVTSIAYTNFLNNIETQEVTAMSKRCSEICDGLGVLKVVDKLEAC